MVAKTRAQLNADADTLFPDNNTGEISPADLRTQAKNLADSAKLAEDLATVASTGAYADLTGKPALATVATTGAYADLTGKPTLGTAAAKDTGTGAGQVPLLDGSGLIPSALLPSYVDDVLEFAATGNFPATGETGKIYVATGTGKIYRWSGSTYVEISASPGSTDAVTEGVTNLYFTAARVLATVLSGLSTATNAAITATDTVLSALGKLQKQITDLTATVAGKVNTSSLATAATASSVVQRDGSGDITTRLFRTEYPSGGGTGAYFLTQNAIGSGADNYARPMPLATVQSTLGIGSMANRSVTISTAAPSGGADGDVWFQV